MSLSYVTIALCIVLIVLVRFAAVDGARTAQAGPRPPRSRRQRQLIAAVEWIGSSIIGVFAGVSAHVFVFGLALLGLFIFGWPSFSDSENMVATVVGAGGGAIAGSLTLIGCQLPLIWSRVPGSGALIGTQAILTITLVCLGLSVWPTSNGGGGVLIFLGYIGAPMMVGAFAWLKRWRHE